MYRFFKKYFKLLLPKKFLFKNELFFRYWYGIFYLGNNHQCNICEKNLRSFISLENNDLLCPFCGSLSRNRRLFHLLNEEKILAGNILHFSPSRCLFRKLRKVNTLSYISSDYGNEFLADYKLDITNIDKPNKIFDLIICYHILEHIIDDHNAISELYRVLKPKGSILIQTPFKKGDTYEDFTITAPDMKKKHFGQEDHVRVYSVDGLRKRLEHAHFKVKTLTFKKAEIDLKFGFKSPETVLIAKK